MHYIGKNYVTTVYKCAFVVHKWQKQFFSWHVIAIALDETGIFVAVHFSMKNIYQFCDLGHAMVWSNLNASQ